MDSVFHEFTELFGNDEEDGNSRATNASRHRRKAAQHSTRNRRRAIIDSSSPESENEADHPDDSQHDDTPAWANQLMKTQRDAMARNEQELRKLRQEVRSLKRKRGESEDVFQWKFKGNEKQHKFNLSVQDKFQEVAEANTLLEARAAAEEGLSLIAERNKHIKIADRDGWDTVELYVNDPLAIDDDDEKKIKRAQKEAERLREKKRKEKESRFRKSKPFAKSGFAKSLDSGPSTSGLRNNQSQRVVNFSSPSDRKFSFRCFRCNKPGHYQKDCTAPGGTQ